MTIDDIVKQLGQDMGMSLALDANRACQLIFDDTIEVDIEADEQGRTMIISSSLANVPASGREALFKALLEANLYGRGTGGGVLALDERFDEIVLVRTLATGHIQYPEVVKELEQFIRLAKTWMERIETFAHGPSAQGASEPQPSTLDANILRA